MAFYQCVIVFVLHACVRFLDEALMQDPMGIITLNWHSFGWVEGQRSTYIWKVMVE